MPLVDPDERMLVIAMDHARALGAVRGLEDPGALIDTMIEAGADAVMTSFGTVKAYRERLVGRVPVYLRLDGGPSIGKEEWLRKTEGGALHNPRGHRALGG